MADDQQTRVGHQVVGGEEQQTEVFFSRDEAQQQEGTPPPTPPTPSQEQPSGGSSPAAADRIAADEHDPYTDKPHLYAAGAFVGAFVFAQVLKRITGGDD